MPKADTIYDNRLGARTRNFSGELTFRQKQVLKLIGKGCTDKEIAQLLFISPRTVNWCNACIYRKMDVGNRVEAYNKAISKGILKPPSQEEEEPELKSFSTAAAFMLCLLALQSKAQAPIPIAADIMDTIGIVTTPGVNMTVQASSKRVSLQHVGDKTIITIDTRPASQLGGK